MATLTLLGTQTLNTTSGTHTVVATPAAGDVIVIVVANTGNTANVAPTDNNSDGAGVYSRINTCVKASSADTLQMWIRESKIGSASSTTFTHAPGTSSGGGLGVFKITGMNRAGLTALRQSAIQSNQAAAGTPTPVLGVAALTGNPLLAAVFNATSPATMTARSSPAWTERFDVGYSTPTTGLETMSIDSGETGTSIAWGGTSASAFASIVAEMDASAAPSALHPVPNKGFNRRKNLTRHRILLSPFPGATPLAASNSRGTSEPPFRTYKTRSRHVVNAVWLAAFVPAQAAVVVPVSAWIVRPVVRRKETQRVVLVPPALKWQYIAPTIAAILPRAKVIKVDFKRKPMADRPLVTSAQPTGPPSHVAWAAVAVKRVSHRKRLVRVPDQASYPATPAAPTSPDSPPERAFVTRVTKSRRLLTVPALLSVAAATPGTSQAPIAALYQSRFKKRKPRPGLFLSSGAETISLAATATAAVYPSFVTRPVKRVEHKRKLQRLASPIGVAAATPANLYPAFVLKRLPAVTHKRKLVKLAAPIGVPAQAVFPSFVLLRPNRAVQKRKLLQLSSPIGVDAAPIVTTPALYPSYLPPRVNVVAFKRTLLTLVDAVGVALTAPPPVDDQPVQQPAGKHRRRRYFVEIDGQTFEVSSEAEAIALLERAREIASRQAEQKAVIAVKRLRSKPRVPTVRIAAPEITVSPALSEATAPLIADIKRLYKQAAETAELRLLLKKQLEAEEDDDDVLLLL